MSTSEEYKQYLYSEVRMEDRCDIFLTKTLPMLEIAAEGHDLKHIVSYSAAMPDQYKNRLSSAARKFPFLDLNQVEDGENLRSPHRVARTMLAELGMSPTTPFGIYRLDDDDILSADYFDQMGAHIIPEKVGHVVSLGHGLTAVYMGGEYRWTRKIYRPLLALGLLSVCRYNSDGTISVPVPSAHTHSARYNPVIQDDRKLSYMWTRSLTQDTMLHQYGKDSAQLLNRILHDFKEYDLPGEEAELAFPVLKSILRMDEISG